MLENGVLEDFLPLGANFQIVAEELVLKVLTSLSVELAEHLDVRVHMDRRSGHVTISISVCVGLLHLF